MGGADHAMIIYLKYFQVFHHILTIYCQSRWNITALTIWSSKFLGYPGIFEGK